MKKKFYHYKHNHPIGIFFAASILFASGTSFLRANLFDVNGPEKQFGLENNATYNWWSSEVWADTTSINDGSNPTVSWQGDNSQSENAYFIGSGGSSDIYFVRLGDTGNVDTYVANIGLNIDAAGQGALPAAVGNVTIGNIGDTGKLIFGINSSVGAANGTLRINNGISLGSSSLNYRGGSSVIAGVISGNVNSGISLGGGEFGLNTGSLVLSGNNSFEGSTSVASSYLLSLRHANALGVSGGSNIVHSGGTMEVAGGVTIGAGESVSIAGDGSAFFGALRAGVGGGTWAGNVILASTGFPGSRVGATDGNTLTITGSIINGAGNNITVSGQNGNGVVILNPTTSNAYTGNTTIARGILRIGKSNALPVGTTLNIDSISGIEEAATFDMAGFHQTVAGLTNSALSEINGKVTNSIAATTSILTVDNSISSSYFGSIEDGNGTVAFVKNGSGSFTLGGVNTYTGTTTVNGGMLEISNASAIGGNEVRVNGGQIAMNGGITVSGKSIVISGSGTNFLGGLQSISGSNQWAGSVTLGADLSRIGAMKNASLVVSGGIGDGSDNFSLVIRNENQSSVNNGAGNASTITELSGANSYDGNTQLIHGLTKLAGGDNRLPTSTIMQFGNEAGANAKFDMNGRNQEIAGLIVMNQSNSITRDWNSNELTNSSATLSTLTVNTASNQNFGLTTTTFSGSSNYTGIITGNVALVKSGLARLTLTSQNTYTGNTTIEGGTLALEAGGSISTSSTIDILASSTLDVSALGNWSLAGGQTLKGIGTVDAGGNNSVTISSGAILAPGFSPGTLLVNGNLSLASGSTYVAELKNSGVIAADLVNIYGDFTIVSGAVLNLQLFDSDAPLADGTKYSIFSYKGNWNNQIFNGYADDSVFTVGLNQFRINYNDTIAGVNGGAYSNFVTLTAVPESNTVLLGSFCVIFLFGRKRKHS